VLLQILSIYWKSVWDSAVSRSNAPVAGHTAADQAVFERRMAALRASERRFVRWTH